MYALLRSWKVFICVAVAITSGCTHDIQMTPNLTALRQLESTVLIDKNVGYYISSENRGKKVVTPGGGGDKVAYKPYSDFEGGLISVLSKVYAQVHPVDSLTDSKIKEKNIHLIFIPEMTTTSSSGSAFTWPPTEFKIDLSCKAVDGEGNVVWQKELRSTGKAEFKEFKGDFSLAARRATESLILELFNEIEKNPQMFR